MNSNDAESTSDDDNYNSESTSTSGSGSKRGEYSYYDIGCPSIWWQKRYLIPETIYGPTSLEISKCGMQRFSYKIGFISWKI